jgi:hypothetical protein
MGKSDDTNKRVSHKARGIAKNVKKYSHHQLRNDNKMCDEDSIQRKKEYETKVNVRLHHGNHACLHKKSNVPNMPYDTLDEELQELEYKWEHTDDTIEKSIDKAIDLRKQNNFLKSGHANKSSYLKATQKQLERRGEVGVFKGHR